MPEHQLSSVISCGIMLKRYKELPLVNTTRCPAPAGVRSPENLYLPSAATVSNSDLRDPLLLLIMMRRSVTCKHENKHANHWQHAQGQLAGSAARMLLAGAQRDLPSSLEHESTEAPIATTLGVCVRGFSQHLRVCGSRVVKSAC